MEFSKYHEQWEDCCSIDFYFILISGLSCLIWNKAFGKNQYNNTRTLCVCVCLCTYLSIPSHQISQEQEAITLHLFYQHGELCVDGTHVAICISRSSATLWTFLAVQLPSASPHTVRNILSTPAQVCLIQIATCLPRSGSRIQEMGAWLTTPAKIRKIMTFTTYLLTFVLTSKQLQLKRVASLRSLVVQKTLRGTQNHSTYSNTSTLRLVSFPCIRPQTFSIITEPILHC